MDYGICMVLKAMHVNVTNLHHLFQTKGSEKEKPKGKGEVWDHRVSIIKAEFQVH